jgi:hypothetical protein
MSGGKHTAGKWSVGHAGFERVPTVVANRPGRPVSVARCYSGKREEDEANARLIASAPDLLEAGQPVAALVAALEGHHGFDDDKPVDARHHGGGYNDFPPLTYGDLRRIAAAVAKATGADQ